MPPLVRCNVEGCRRKTGTRCRSCDASVCSEHRQGAFPWVRCLTCTAQQLQHAQRVWWSQEREEREGRCGYCGSL